VPAVSRKCSCACALFVLFCIIVCRENTVVPAPFFCLFFESAFRENNAVPAPFSFWQNRFSRKYGCACAVFCKSVFEEQLLANMFFHKAVVRENTDVPAFFIANLIFRDDTAVPAPFFAKPLFEKILLCLRRFLG